jgi:hypothetical protein
VLPFGCDPDTEGRVIRKKKPGLADPNRLSPVVIKAWTGYDGDRPRGIIPVLRRGRFLRTNDPVAGDAPKDFIRVYDYEAGQIGVRTDPAAWPAYIAKVGHKWYPGESITEQLMTRLGEALGLRMASSRLMFAGDQLRFLSRYFLQTDESLVHGAEILGGYIEDDDFVTDVEQEHLETEIFTFQVLCTATTARFSPDHESILRDFVRMIGFDALVGNQDRHMYNWGVVVHAKAARPSRFSPIYDTARGLFWNHPDSKLAKFGTDDSLRRYVLAAHPLIGLDGKEQLNHFELVGGIARCGTQYAEALHELSQVGCQDLGMVIDDEFGRLLSVERRQLIKRCLRMRFRFFDDAIAGGR